MDDGLEKLKPASRIGAEIAGDADGRLLVRDLQLREEYPPGIDKTGCDRAEKELFRIRSDAAASEGLRAPDRNR
jgi:hypothetical protein